MHAIVRFFPSPKAVAALIHDREHQVAIPPDKLLVCHCKLVLDPAHLRREKLCFRKVSAASAATGAWLGSKAIV
jgi:hypothetical protein